MAFEIYEDGSVHLTGPSHENIVGLLERSRKLMRDIFIRYEDPQEMSPMLLDDVEALANQVIEIDKMLEELNSGDGYLYFE